MAWRLVGLYIVGLRQYFWTWDLNFWFATFVVRVLCRRYRLFFFFLYEFTNFIYMGRTASAVVKISWQGSRGWAGGYHGRRFIRTDSRFVHVLLWKKWHNRSTVNSADGRTRHTNTSLVFLISFSFFCPVVGAVRVAFPRHTRYSSIWQKLAYVLSKGSISAIYRVFRYNLQVRV